MAKTIAVCLNDVNRFRVTCPECNTSMETTREHLATVFDGGRTCPACSTSFGGESTVTEVLAQALEALAKWAWEKC